MAADGATATLRVSEIFHSIQGESTRAGLPTTFIRLTGCPLRCNWCDTEHAFTGGTTMTIAEILARVGDIGCPTVCVTGGEPLAQKRCLQLLAKLCDAGYEVSLETSGAIDIAGVDARVSRVLDIKTPGSAEVERNLWDNLALLTPRDQVKFVICSRADFDWAKGIVAEHRLHEVCDVLFSPSAAQVPARELADWIVAEKLPVRFQMQLHKLLWNDEPGR